MKRLNLKEIAGWIFRMFKIECEFIRTIGNEEKRISNCERFVKNHYLDLNERQIKQVTKYLLSLDF